MKQRIASIAGADTQNVAPSYSCSVVLVAVVMTRLDGLCRAAARVSTQDDETHLMVIVTIIAIPDLFDVVQGLAVSCVMMQ